MRVQSLIQRAKRRHGFSAADLSDPLKSNYAEIGLAAVGRTESEIRTRVDLILEALDHGGETDVLGVEEIELGGEARP